MKLSEAKKNFIFTTRVEFEDEFVELREPTQQEVLTLKKNTDDDIGIINKMETIFSACLINHSFIDDNGEKAKPEDVYNVLKESATLFNEILTQWMESLPFHSRTKKSTK